MWVRVKSSAGERAEIEHELAFFRKDLHRMRYYALKEGGIAIGAGGPAAGSGPDQSRRPTAR